MRRWRASSHLGRSRVCSSDLPNESDAKDECSLYRTIYNPKRGTRLGYEPYGVRAQLDYVSGCQPKRVQLNPSRAKGPAMRPPTRSQAFDLSANPRRTCLLLAKAISDSFTQERLRDLADEYSASGTSKQREGRLSRLRWDEFARPLPHDLASGLPDPMRGLCRSDGRHQKRYWCQRPSGRPTRGQMAARAGDETLQPSPRSVGVGWGRWVLTPGLLPKRPTRTQRLLWGRGEGRSQSST